MSRIPLSLVALVSLLWLTPARADPDPVALLRAVEASREPWRGELAMTMTSESVRPKTGKPRVIQLEVAFDGPKRRFVQEERNFIVDLPKPGVRPTPSEKFKAIGLDTEQGAALGLGRWVRVKTRTAFDGKAIYSFDDHNSAVVRDPQAGSTGLCFDPRVHGLVGNPTFDRTLPNVLNYASAKAVRLEGSEEIRGNKVWRVAVESPVEGLSYHFWVEDREGHRVHRYEYVETAEKSGRWRKDLSEMHYDEGKPFPSKVVMDRRAWNEHYVVTTVVTKANTSKPDATVFGMSGLDVPPGEEVVDERISQKIGYWDGKGVTKDRPAAVQRFADDAAGRWRWRDHAWQVALVALGLALAAAGVWYLRRVRARAAA